MHVISGPGGPVEGPPKFELPFLGRTEETPTATTFRFSTKGSGFHYASNQAIRLVMPGVADPRGPGRTFSLSSSPTEEGAIAVTMTMTGSPFKERLRSMVPGEVATVLGPLGEFLYDRERPALFLAGGIGITPFRGMIRFASDTRAPMPIRLLYSARVPEEFAFRTELDEIARHHPSLEVRYTVTRPEEAGAPWDGRTGRIDAPWIREALDGLDRPKVYVVGAPAMVRELVELVMGKLEVPEADVDWELFRGY